MLLVPLPAPVGRLEQGEVVEHGAVQVGDRFYLQVRCIGMHARVAPPDVHFLKELQRHLLLAHTSRWAISC